MNEVAEHLRDRIVNVGEAAFIKVELGVCIGCDNDAILLPHNNGRCICCVHQNEKEN